MGSQWTQTEFFFSIYKQAYFAKVREYKTKAENPPAAYFAKVREYKTKAENPPATYFAKASEYKTSSIIY